MSQVHLENCNPYHYHLPKPALSSHTSRFSLLILREIGAPAFPRVSAHGAGLFYWENRFFPHLARIIVKIAKVIKPQDLTNHVLMNLKRVL